MSRILQKSTLILLFFSLFGNALYGQKIRVYLNGNKISTDQVLQLNLEISGGSGQVNYPNFPEIKSFQAGGISTSQNTSMGFGQNVNTFTFTRQYFPTKVGKFSIPSFVYEALGQRFVSPEMAVEVVKGSGQKPQQQQNQNPFGFFGGQQRQTNPNEIQYQETNADYFLAINLDKNECYVGEQVSGEVVLYINERDFGKVNVDVRDIIDMQQRIKNKDFWEEIIEFREIPTNKVVVNGKRYIAYTMYKTILFPLNPGVTGFKNIWMSGKKLHVATNLHPFDRMMGMGNKYEPIKIKAADRLLKVKALPTTILENAGSVGKFTMDAKISHEKIKTGEPLELKVNIKGNGNITLVPPPTLRKESSFQSYDVASDYTIHKSESSLYGEKEFTFVFVPTRAGEFNLGPLKFYYFKPAEQQYDSLQLEYLPILVEGENLENMIVKTGILDGFYKDRMELASDKVSWRVHPGKFGFLGLLSLVGLSALSVGIRKRKSQKKGKSE